MGVEYIYFKQTNSLDRRNRTLNISATNESFVSRVDINENCKYFVSRFFKSIWRGGGDTACNW